MSSLWEPALLSRDRNPTGTSQNFWRQEFKSCLGAKKTKSLWAIQRTKADIGKWSIAFPGPSCYCALPFPQLSTPTGADQRPLDVGSPEAGGLLGLGGHTYGTRAEIRQDTGSACVSRLWNPQHTASCLHERCESQCPGENDSLSLEESTDVKHEAGVGSVASQESGPMCTHTPATHIVSNPNPIQKTACLFGDSFVLFALSARKLRVQSVAQSWELCSALHRPYLRMLFPPAQISQFCLYFPGPPYFVIGFQIFFFYYSVPILVRCLKSFMQEDCITR